MNIVKKIEEIRKKPEHIREKYVWVAVGICMVFIFAMWISSFRTIFKGNEMVEKNVSIKNIVDKSQDAIKDMPSITDIERVMTESVENRQ